MTGREHIGRAKEAICEIITKNRDDDNLEPDREKSAVEIGSVCHDLHDASEDGGGVVFDRHPLQSPHVARFRHDELYLRVPFSPEGSRGPRRVWTADLYILPFILRIVLHEG